MNECDIPDLNLFMMCATPKTEAYGDIPEGYHLRFCRREELERWKAFPFDTAAERDAYRAYMTEYFENVYAPHGDLFYRTCLFLCDAEDRPVATCFAWKAYGQFYTIHWLKVLKSHENQGLGRAILTETMKSIPADGYPVYLHTQPSSFRAIKLYTDFGFSLLTDESVGNRKNQYREAMPYLEHFMKPEGFRRLTFHTSDGQFSAAASQVERSEF